MPCAIPVAVAVAVKVPGPEREAGDIDSVRPLGALYDRLIVPVKFAPVIASVKLPEGVPVG